MASVFEDGRQGLRRSCRLSLVPHDFSLPVCTLPACWPFRPPPPSSPRWAGSGFPRSSRRLTHRLRYSGDSVLVLPRRVRAFQPYCAASPPSSRLRPSPFRLRSVLHGWSPATMTSADFWVTLSMPCDIDSLSQAVSQTSPGNALHFHAYARHIYFHSFRTGIGLQVLWPPCPLWLPRMWFLFVGPAFCYSEFRSLGFLQIRGRPRHPCRSLTIPPVGFVEDLAFSPRHLLVKTPYRAHHKKKGLPKILGSPR